jgi:pimeloyl-ACP methyl ester carboxylesterase
MELAQLPPVPGVSHRHVRVRGVELHVAEAGAGPPLILLHGWPQHWWSWRRLIPRLAQEFRVLAPDLRGWGWSAAPPGDYAKATFAADVLALMAAEGLERASVIGHDWGAYTAFLLALDHPDRITRMVCLDVAPPWRGVPRLRHLALPVMASYQALLATPVLGPLTMTQGDGFVRAIIRAGSGPAMHWHDAELDAYARVLRDPRRAAASSACYRTFLTRELPGIVRGDRKADDLEVPTLLVLGGASPLRRALDPRPSRNLRVEHVPGAGHFLPEEAPGEVGELALAHLAP